MTLSILNPIVVLPENVASNVALETEWIAGTYTLGEQVRIDDTLHEVVVNSTTDDPTSVTSDWVNIGPANRYAAFDLQVGADKYKILETSTINDDLIEFTLTGLSRIGAIYFFGLDATQIEIEAVSEGETVLDVTYDLVDDTDYNGSVFDWFFMDANLQTQHGTTEINIPSEATITIRVHNNTAVAAVSSIALGFPMEYGTVTVGTSKKLRSRAVRLFDGLLATLIPRRPTYTVDYKFVLQENAADSFWRRVEGLRGKPAVFSGPDNHPEFAAYGYVESANGSAVGGKCTVGSLSLGTI